MELNLTRKKTLDIIVTEINRMVEWWDENYKSDNIVEFINLRSRLTGHLYTFATYIGETKMEYLNSERERKVKKSRTRKQFKEADNSIAASEDEAILATEEEQKRVDDFEGYYVMLRLMLDQANKVDDAIQQKIAILRKEKDG